MLASLRSDFYLMRSYFKTIFGVFLFMVVMSFVQQSDYFVFFYAAFMAVYLPISLFSLSEQSGWESMLLSAPVTRSGIVRGRYLMCAATDFAFVLIGAAVALAINRDTGVILPMLVSLSIALFLNAIMLPLIYRFGPTKARFAMMAVCIIPAIVLPLVLDILDSGSQLHLSAFVQSLEPIPVLLLICLVCALLFLLSHLLSCRIYGKKEF